MGTKKDIGKLFQEKFKDFEQAPDAGSWDAIAAGLDGKNSNRYFVPLWITIGSVLVLGVIVLFLWQPWTAQIDTNIPQKIVDTPPYNETKSLEQNEASKDLSNDEKDSIKELKSIAPLSSANNNNTVATETQPENKTTLNESDRISDQKSATSNTKAAKTAANLSSSNTGNLNAKPIASSASKSQKSKLINSTSTSYSSNTSNKIARDENAPGIVKMNAALKDRLIARERAAREAYKLNLSKEKEAMESKRQAQIAYERSKRDSISKATKTAALAQAEKEAKEKAAKNKDKSASEPKSAVEKSIDRNEAVTYNFAISPYVSALSYGSLAKGSSIDDRLVNNPREAIGTQGYGIRVEYSLSERASFRFGVGVSPLKYRTNNFQVLNNGGTINVYQFSGLTPTQLEQGGTPTDPEAVAFFNNFDVITIEQNISYLEIPLDYQYKFINKRIGLSLNPGVSIFILTDNNVFAIADDATRLRIGRETSLNDLSFAFNLGLGGHYNFAKHWRLDVEPTFRYQLNPYSNSLSNFKPYYLGVQFGASYKF